MSEREALGESRERTVRAELDHLLESPAFRTSKRCREFLTYIVEHTMTGQRVTLKERSIGVDLFQLPYDFDTGQHTIVRVTASEVRKKLRNTILPRMGTSTPFGLTYRQDHTVQNLSGPQGRLKRIAPTHRNAMLRQPTSRRRSSRLSKLLHPKEATGREEF
jgi:hypothetical protein